MGDDRPSDELVQWQLVGLHCYTSADVFSLTTCFHLQKEQHLLSVLFPFFFLTNIFCLFRKMNVTADEKGIESDTYVIFFFGDS